MLTAKIDKLKALVMWLWRRLERMSWMDKKSNEEVLTMVYENMSHKNYIPQEEELDRTCA